MKRIATIVASIVLSACMTGAAIAKAPGDVTVTNGSRTCAWITVYGGWTLNPVWEIVTGENARPRFIRAGQSFHFHGQELDRGWSDVKVRAEPTRNGDCSGGTIGDTNVAYVISTSRDHGFDLKPHLWNGTGNGFYFTK